MYPGSLRVPAAARCHCFRLPNNSLALRCGGWYGVGPWGPPVGTSGTLPRTEWPKWYHHVGPSTIPPPFALLLQEQVLFRDSPETAAEEDKGQVAGCVVKVWGGLTHAPSFSACQFFFLSVCSRK